MADETPTPQSLIEASGGKTKQHSDNRKVLNNRDLTLKLEVAEGFCNLKMFLKSLRKGHGFLAF